MLWQNLWTLIGIERNEKYCYELSGAATSFYKTMNIWYIVFSEGQDEILIHTVTAVNNNIIYISVLDYYIYTITNRILSRSYTSAAGQYASKH